MLTVKGNLILSRLRKNWDGVVTNKLHKYTLNWYTFGSGKITLDNYSHTQSKMTVIRIISWENLRN